MTTKGEYRVGIDFNPSANDLVTRIKRSAADLIDLITSVQAGDNPLSTEAIIWERDRLIGKACDAIEEGAMWAVKAATKQAIAGELFTAPATVPVDPFVGLVKEALDLLAEANPVGATSPPAAVLMQEITRYLADRGFRHVGVADIQGAIDSIASERGA